MKIASFGNREDKLRGGRVAENNVYDKTATTSKIASGAVSNSIIYELSSDVGDDTTSSSWVDIPGYSITFTLDDSALVLLNFNHAGFITGDVPSSGLSVTIWNVFGYFKMILDDTEVTGSQRVLSKHGYYHSEDEVGDKYGSITAQTLQALGAGNHTVKVQFRVTANDVAITDVRVGLVDRILQALILKR